MPQRMRRRPPRLWLVPLCAAVIALVTAVGPVTPTSAGAISSAKCAARVNDTPSKLVECIQTDDLWNHMKAFQAIADANPGPDGHPSRNSGEPGYKASVDYVAKLMTEAGYNVTIQTYNSSTLPSPRHRYSTRSHPPRMITYLPMNGVPGKAQGPRRPICSRPATSSSRRPRRPARQAAAPRPTSRASCRVGSR
jgi:hypothetical protein